MQVVLLSEAIQPPLTGVGRYAWELAQGLSSDDGVESVSFLAHGRWQTLEILKQRLSEEGVNPKLDSWKFGSLAVFKQKLRVSLGSLQPVALAYESLQQWLGEKSLHRLYGQMGTVVHGPCFFAPPSDLPTVVTFHDLSTFLYPETQPSSRVLRVEVMLKTAIREGFTIITDAQCTANDLVATMGVAANKVHAVHLGVSSSFRPHDMGESEPVLARYGLAHGTYTLSVGTAEPRKNLVRLLDAYEALASDIRSAFPLVLVGGKGWNDSHLLRRIERGIASGWVQTLGYVPEDDLPFLYGGARLFVYVSLYEGFGLPIAEAMACGAPVITSNTSSMPEVAASAALLVNPFDTDEISKELARGLIDNEWRSNAKIKGLKRASELTWTNTVSETLNVYHKILNDK
jgi:alpha-1,3-rhamnosyl/mannosyltransferase